MSDSTKRVLFAVGLMWSILYAADTRSEDYEWWVNFLLTLPLLFFSLAIASRFWPYPGDKNDRKN